MDFVRSRRPISAALLAGRGHYEAVIAAVMAAKRSVWIATANLKELMVEDPRARPGQRRTMRAGSGRYCSVMEIFEELVSRGVEIRILHAGEPSSPFQAELRRRESLRVGTNAFELRRCPRVHFKTVVIDGAQAYLGSANWTGAGLGAKGEGRRNFEVGFLSADDLLLDEIQAMFDHVWQGAPCAGCKLRTLCPRPLDQAPALLPTKKIRP